MTSFPAISGKRTLAVVPSAGWRALLTLAALVGIGSVANASCGDWLADPGHSMAVADQTPVGISDGQANLVSGRAPCDGPYCRKAPDQPAPPVPLIISIQTEKLGISAPSAASISEVRRFGVLRESNAHPATGYPLRVEHPPRV